MNTKSQLRLLELDDLCRPDRREWTLLDLLAVFRRRRAFLLWPLTASLLLVTAYCLVATPRFRATAQIEVQKESPGVFGLETDAMGNSRDVDSDSLDYSMTLETEARILQSGSLALQVIKDLHLETTSDYFPEHSPGLRFPAWILFWKKPVEPMSVPIDDAPDRRYVVLKIFASHLKVTPLVGTRLIEISYSDPDPKLAAKVVNRLVQTLMDYSFQARFNATAQASDWLAGQLVGLRRQTEELQQKAIRLQRDTGIFGDESAHNVVLARLERLNEAQIAAESNRILKEAIYKASQSGDPELISGLAGNSAVGASPAMTNSLALIQTLRSQEAALRAEIAEDDTKYGSAFPRLAELHAQLDGLETSIQEEVHRIGERSRTDFEIASDAERSARDSFEEQKRLTNETSDRAIAYSLARQEADASRNIYQGLLAKLKEAGVLEGLRSTNLIVINPARIPPRNRPQSPNTPLYYAAALATGLFIGCSSALVRELQDRSIRSAQELEEMLGSHLLGVIPRVNDNTRFPGHRARRAGIGITAPRMIRSIAAIADSRNASAYESSPFLEALRSVRTSLLSSYPARPPKVILVTSSVAGEGKSKLAASLACVLTQLDTRVLIVDADLRCPTLHKELGIDGTAGLGAVLFEGSLPIVHPHPELPELSVLCGTSTPALPSELLASQRMNELLAGWRSEYDFILLDSPPVLPVTDARILARLCDATLLVARHGFASRQAVQRSQQLIQQELPEHATLGAVLNGVSVESADYYEYYGYRNSGYGSRYQRKRYADA
ncbi:MAG: polysaccharide biosynthesis tyrosine autokinase [Acidobacteriaceae bacterium]|nr:polysaccharide biosynthesis tyrosine autokinase [Acidobacteriaceae bacterium]